MAETKPLVIMMSERLIPSIRETLSPLCQVIALNEDRLMEVPEMDPIALFVWHTVSIDGQFWKRCASLRLVIRMGVGYDNVDIVSAGKLGIAVANVPNYGTEEVADAAMSHILNLYRRTVQLEAWTRKSMPLKNDAHTKEICKDVVRIRGQKLGLVGMGRIATAVCNRAKPFGFDISFYDPYLELGIEKAHGVQRHHSLEDLLGNSDIVSFHCNLTPENRHMLNTETLSKVKSGVRIVNTARGGLIDEAALVEALDDGRVSCAALDVHEKEPYIAKESALSKFPNVYSLPHIAYFSEQSAEEVYAIAAQELSRALSPGGSYTGLRSCVNLKYMRDDNNRWP